MYGKCVLLNEITVIHNRLILVTLVNQNITVTEYFLIFTTIKNYN